MEAVVSVDGRDVIDGKPADFRNKRGYLVPAWGSVDIDGFEGFSGSDALQCRRCGFGFIFQLLEDYYPAPSTGFIVCDRDARVLAAGRGVFELTGYREQDLIGALIFRHRFSSHPGFQVFALDPDWDGAGGLNR